MQTVFSDSIIFTTLRVKFDGAILFVIRSSFRIKTAKLKIKFCATERLHCDIAQMQTIFIGILLTESLKEVALVQPIAVIVLFNLITCVFLEMDTDFQKRIKIVLVHIYFIIAHIYDHFPRTYGLQILSKEVCVSPKIIEDL